MKILKNKMFLSVLAGVVTGVTLKLILMQKKAEPTGIMVEFNEED